MSTNTTSTKTKTFEIPTLGEINWDTIDDETKQLYPLIKKAKDLYKTHFGFVSNKKNDNHNHDSTTTAYIVTAPGRVNLIGEHTDYTGGYVLPLAIQYATVCYGTGRIQKMVNNTDDDTSTRTTQQQQPEQQPTHVTLQLISDQAKKKKISGHTEEEGGETASVVEEIQFSCTPKDLEPPTVEGHGTVTTWLDYIRGVLAQYIPDLPQYNYKVELYFSYSSNVPLGSGLSSSASLEVATAMLLECILRDYVYSSCPGSSSSTSTATSTTFDIPRERALRCQRAENLWANSPCGIMDQMASSCCLQNHFMLLDCTSMEIKHIPMKTDTTTTSNDNDENEKVEDGTEPVFVICNSGVTHAINVDAEYGKRRKECHEATVAIQSIQPLVKQLRDATIQDVTIAFEQNKLNELLYKRAYHVVTENERVLQCTSDLQVGLWDKVGHYMNLSHISMRDYFEVSCPEIDFLVETAITAKLSSSSSTTNEDGTGTVYGSRLTGGGFGGCTVTLVQKKYATSLINMLQSAYQTKYEKHCPCFITKPANGARIIAMDNNTIIH